MISCYQLELARILLDCGANVNAKNKRGHTPLYQYLLYLTPEDDRQHWPVARLFVERGADVNERGSSQQTLLHWASERRELECMQNLLDFGANVNAVDKWGRTPLHLVHFPDEGFDDEDNFASTQLLVLRGADVNQPDNRGSMPLHLVLTRYWEMDLELVRLLVDVGAKVNVKDHQGQTPLHTMLRQTYEPDKDIFCAVLQLLMEHGADVNAQNNGHETPLHMALHLPWLEIVRLEVVCILLGHGADLSMENKEEMKRPQSKYSAMRARRVESVVTMSLLYGY
ncbi:ankyrin repeat-containing domain protein [Lactarius akahatsu]|uniref:Ankyrin repeat-containing domain protein n=1 Tax=Lactarius akahatsu TaxID=416441 RepID=A0AAD4Q9V2_9AGAM|nr:ankyrin repeat-containing domain protein [Lactarius akahatsu]